MRQKLVHIWNAFWFPSGPPHALALARILLGGFLVVFWLRFLPYTEYLFSGEGFAIPKYPAPPSLFQARSPADLVGWLTASPSLPRAYACLLLQILASLGIALGFRFRLSSAVYLGMAVYHYYLYIHEASYSYDRVLFLSVCLLAISPCAEVMSLDARRAEEKGRAPTETTSLWTQRLLAVQLALVYFGTGVAKLLSPAWSTGELLTETLHADWATPLGFWVTNLGFSPGLWDLGVVLAVLFELSALTLFFNRRWQPLYMVVGFCFHLSNTLLLSVWEFLALPLLYPVFLDPGLVRDWYERRFQKRPPVVDQEMARRWYHPVEWALENGVDERESHEFS